MSVAIHWSTRGQLRLPLSDRKRDVFGHHLTQAKLACKQILERVDIDRLRNSRKRLLSGFVCAAPTLLLLGAAANGTSSTTVDNNRFILTFGDQAKNTSDLVQRYPAKVLFTQTFAAARTPRQTGARSVDLSSLRGMPLADLNALYFGIEGRAPQSATIDFGANLEQAWQRKLAIPDVSGATQKSYREILDRWHTGSPGVSTIEDFVLQADNEINQIRPAIHYEAFCAHLDEGMRRAATKDKQYLGNDGCSLVRAIAANITGGHLIARGMTEIFPARDGEKNVRLMQVLLREAGSEYLNTIPALGDTYLSFGFYQFTSLALRYDEVVTERGGANKVSLFADEQFRVPDSVKLLEHEKHHRAAFYFDVYNLALMVRSLNAKDRAVLRAVYAKKISEVAKFMAAAHHNPRDAIRGARAWLRAGGSGQIDRHLTYRLKVYAAKKWDSNHRAVVHYLKETQS